MKIIFTKIAAAAILAIKKVYRLIPLNIRYFCTSHLWNLGYSLRKIFEPIYPEVFIYSGKDKTTGLPLIFAYAGNRIAKAQEFWAQTALTPDFQKY